MKNKFQHAAAKIICTIGPASGSISKIKRLAFAGMTIARLNFSHGSHTEHTARLGSIRSAELASGHHIQVLQDLEGHRIRVGRLPQNRSISIRKGQIVRFCSGRLPADGYDTLPLNYDGSLSGIRVGSNIFIDDGKIMLSVLSSRQDMIRARVLVPGLLKTRKGVNISGFKFPSKGITAKDAIDLVFGIKNRVDFMAQSFVRNKEDVLKLKERITAIRPPIKIIAKIENEDGIRNIDQIIREADGIMVARGDMGVSIPIYKVPVVQKSIIKKCNRMKKFVITATQMLDSMTENPRPTRAEVSDVANAFLDGSDYLMLSAETAVGRYPVESVKMMREIIGFTKKSIKNRVI